MNLSIVTGFEKEGEYTIWAIQELPEAEVLRVKPVRCESEIRKPLKWHGGGEVSSTWSDHGADREQRCTGYLSGRCEWKGESKEPVGPKPVSWLVGFLSASHLQAPLFSFFLSPLETFLTLRFCVNIVFSFYFLLFWYWFWIPGYSL